MVQPFKTKVLEKENSFKISYMNSDFHIYWYRNVILVGSECQLSGHLSWKS